MNESLSTEDPVSLAVVAFDTRASNSMPPTFCRAHQLLVKTMYCKLYKRILHQEESEDKVYQGLDECDM